MELIHGHAQIIKQLWRLASPLLKFYSSDQKYEHSIHFQNDAIKILGRPYSETVSNDWMKQKGTKHVPSGQQEVFLNRVGWARTYMKKAGLLESPRRGIFVITERGISYEKCLASNPAKIENRLLTHYEEFKEFKLEKDISKKKPKF